MIKIKIITIGKNKDRWVTEAINHYNKIISKYAEISWDIIPNIKNSSTLLPNEIKQKEAELFNKKIDNDSFIALTERGVESDSINFSEKFNKMITAHKSRLIFVIGGAYGLDTKLLNEAPYKISLSKLTFSHQLVRLVLLEQLYRAFSILNNTDYHK